MPPLLTLYDTGKLRFHCRRTSRSEGSVISREARSTLYFGSCSGKQKHRNSFSLKWAGIPLDQQMICIVSICHHRFLEDCKKTFSLFLVHKRPKRLRTSAFLTMTGIQCTTSLRPPGFHRHQGEDYPEDFPSGVWISSFRQMTGKR